MFDVGDTSSRVFGSIGERSMVDAAVGPNEPRSHLLSDREFHVSFCRRARNCAVPAKRTSRQIGGSLQSVRSRVRCKSAAIRFLAGRCQSEKHEADRLASIARHHILHRGLVSASRSLLSRDFLLGSSPHTHISRRIEQRLLAYFFRSQEWLNGYVDDVSNY